MTNFELPRNLVEDFQDEAPDSARRAWLAGPEGFVAEMVETWSLTDVRRPSSDVREDDVGDLLDGHGGDDFQRRGLSQ